MLGSGWLEPDARRPATLMDPGSVESGERRIRGASNPGSVDPSRVASRPRCRRRTGHCDNCSRQSDIRGWADESTWGTQPGGELRGRATTAGRRVRGVPARRTRTPGPMGLARRLPAALDAARREGRARRGPVRRGHPGGGRGDGVRRPDRATARRGLTDEVRPVGRPRRRRTAQPGHLLPGPDHRRRTPPRDGRLDRPDAMDTDDRGPRPAAFRRHRRRARAAPQCAADRPHGPIQVTGLLRN
jgi:hypothetical protein